LKLKPNKEEKFFKTERPVEEGALKGRNVQSLEEFVK
jgi:hypothetical protein